MAGAITCPAHAGMHLRENHVIAEIVGPDGAGLPPGEIGELVITTVGMEALPLIRYRTGDFTSILPGACPCGSETIRLGPLFRRKGKVDFPALEDAVFAHPEVVDYRAECQDDRLTLTIRSRADWDPMTLESDASTLLPGARLQISNRPLRETDGFLYAGKRGCL